jgi:hypothetical protein
MYIQVYDNQFPGITVPLGANINSLYPGKNRDETDYLNLPSYFSGQNVLEMAVGDTVFKTLDKDNFMSAITNYFTYMRIVRGGVAGYSYVQSNGTAYLTPTQVDWMIFHHELIRDRPDITGISHFLVYAPTENTNPAYKPSNATVAPANYTQQDDFYVESTMHQAPAVPQNWAYTRRVPMNNAIWYGPQGVSIPNGNGFISFEVWRSIVADNVVSQVLAAIDIAVKLNGVRIVIAAPTKFQLLDAANNTWVNYNQLPMGGYNELDIPTVAVFYRAPFILAQKVGSQPILPNYGIVWRQKPRKVFGLISNRAGQFQVATPFGAFVLGDAFVPNVPPNEPFYGLGFNPPRTDDLITSATLLVFDNLYLLTEEMRDLVFMDVE